MDFFGCVSGWGFSGWNLAAPNFTLDMTFFLLDWVWAGRNVLGRALEHSFIGIKFVNDWHHAFHKTPMTLLCELCVLWRLDEGS